MMIPERPVGNGLAGWIAHEIGGSGKGGTNLKPNAGILAIAILLGVQLPSIAGVPPPDTPEALILSLYAHHRPTKNKGIDTCDRRALAKYCDGTLTDLFLKDCACSKRTGEVCNLDWDPFYDAQDFGEEEPNPRIKRIAGTDSFEVTITNLGETRLTYEMKKTKAGWRVANIRSAKWDLLKVLNGTQK
jgi:hypothetical protein